VNIAETIGFDGLEDLVADEKMKPFVKDLVRRLESFKKDQINQLRAEPTVFYANPVTQPELIAGSKPGDVAVWVDGAGVSQFEVLQ